MSEEAVHHHPMVLFSELTVILLGNLALTAEQHPSMPTSSIPLMPMSSTPSMPMNSTASMRMNNTLACLCAALRACP